MAKPQFVTLETIFSRSQEVQTDQSEAETDLIEQNGLPVAEEHVKSKAEQDLEAIKNSIGLLFAE
jgi:hypothetical protein